jgi:hypothetical protein
MTVELFTALTPITPGEEVSLRQVLAGLPTGPASPLEQVPGTHAARFVVMDHLGMGHPVRRRPLRPALLMFSAVLDGPVEVWLSGVRTGLRETAEAVWSHCRGWPGTEDSRPFAQWLLRHRLKHTMPFIAHRDATLDQVLQGLELREKLMKFVLENQGLPAAHIRKAYEEAFGSAVVPA